MSEPIKLTVTKQTFNKATYHTCIISLTDSTVQWSSMEALVQVSLSSVCSKRYLKRLVRTP
ncbi:hypothetical protein NENIHHPF_00118 [Enterococcus phage EF_FB]